MQQKIFAEAELGQRVLMSNTADVTVGLSANPRGCGDEVRVKQLVDR